MDFKKLDANTMENLVKQKGKFFVIFTTTWCSDCKIMKALLKDRDIFQKYPQWDFIEVDAEESDLFRKQTDEWKVQKIPAFYTIDNNDKTFLGYEYIPMEIIENKLNS